MRTLALTICAVLALALPVFAAEDQFDEIGALSERVGASLVAGVITDTAALDELYAVATDDTVAPTCQKYADVVLVSWLLIEHIGTYGDSWAIGVLFEYSLEGVAVFGNDCQLAI